MKRLLVLTAATVACVTVVCLAAVAAAATSPDASPIERTGDPYTVVVTDEMRSHQHWLDGLYFGGTAWSLAMFVVLLATGASARIRDLALRVSRRPFLAAMVFYALFSIARMLLMLPVRFTSGYWLPHAFALSEQSAAAWIWDLLKGLALGIAIGAPLLAFALQGIRRVRRWWLALWLGTAPIALFLTVIGPVLLDPVFNDFVPLEDEQLRVELLELASEAGIQGGRVFQVDKSKQTKTINAYVNGLGPTKRIILWDTIIAALDREELRVVMAHEMGHYVRNHVWKIGGMLLVLMFGVFWLGQRVVEASIARWGTQWGFDRADDPAATTLLLLVISTLMFLLSPVTSGGVRYFEHEADTFALELTHDNDASARAFVKLATVSKVLPEPHPFIKFWRYTHPSLAERIVYFRTHKPWERGEPNQVYMEPAR